MNAPNCDLFHLDGRPFSKSERAEYFDRVSDRIRANIARAKRESSDRAFTGRIPPDEVKP